MKHLRAAALAAITGVLSQQAGAKKADLGRFGAIPPTDKKTELVLTREEQEDLRSVAERIPETETLSHSVAKQVDDILNGRKA